MPKNSGKLHQHSPSQPAAQSFFGSQTEAIADYGSLPNSQQQQDESTLDGAEESIVLVNGDKSPQTESGYPRNKFAWVVLITGFVSLLVLNGVYYTFAMLLVEWLEEFPSGYGSTALILGIQVFCGSFFGGPVGQAIDKYGYQRITLAGAIFSALSIYLSSISTQLWHLMITFGFLYGTAQALTYFPTMGIVQAWFPGKAAEAIGIAVSGSAMGGIIFPPLVRYLIINYGWRRYLQVAAALVGIINVLAACVYIQPTDPGNKKKEKVAVSFVKDPVFLMLCATLFILSLAYYAPPAHVVAYAMENGIKSAHASNLIMYNGAASFAGRIVLGMTGSRVSVYYLYIVCVLISGICTSLVPLYNTETMITVYYTVYGFFSAVYGATCPLLVLKAMGQDRFNQAFGFVKTSETASVLLSASLAGWIRDVSGNYDYAFVVVGCFYGLSALPVLAIQALLSSRRKQKNSPPQ